jgi:hypothetical protein
MRAVVLGSMLALACSQGKRGPAGGYVADPPGDAGDGSTLIDSGGGVCGEFCGETFLTEVTEPKNLYFVLDRSGSMETRMADSSLTRYQTARAVLASLLRTIGHRVSYGAAAFPTTANATDCSPGGQIFPATRGGLPPCEGGDDIVLENFIERLGTLAPVGGTPTAATLRELLPTLRDLDGETYVVLVTDGAPNCNVDAVCEASECTLNIEGQNLGARACDSSFNCCDSRVIDGAGAYCVDGDATEQAVRDLADSGIPTYVVGMPGAGAYAALLDRLAVVGGTAREGDVGYYAADDTEELREALYAIGTEVAIRCSIELDAPPDDPNLVNVYFDGEIVSSDPDDGWSWDGDRTIVVNGDACDRLESGTVIDARAVFGCDTVVR